MKYALFSVLAFLVTDCCPRIASKSTTVDTVYVEKPVYIPEKTGFFSDIILSDSVFIEDPNLELTLLPMPGDKMKVKYKIKKDTVFIPTPQITITNDVVIEKKVTAWWSYLVLGAGLLIALLALLRR